MASCKADTLAYRNCLKDSRSSGSGGGGSKKCTPLAQTLEACREKWRQENQIEHQFDGTRILLHPTCQPLNQTVQQCLKWKNADESQCQFEIQTLKTCMKDHQQGILAPPTAGDKIWSDYKNKNNQGNKDKDKDPK